MGEIGGNAEQFTLGVCAGCREISKQALAYG